MSASLPDVRGREDIAHFVGEFYQKIAKDALLAPIFFDVAKVDLALHLDRIIAYWEKMLFGDDAYRRNMINKHVAIHSVHPLEAMHFQRWLLLFTSTVRGAYAGPKADRACLLAERISKNMRQYVESLSV